MKASVALSQSNKLPASNSMLSIVMRFWHWEFPSYTDKDTRVRVMYISTEFENVKLGASFERSGVTSNFNNTEVPNPASASQLWPYRCHGGSAEVKRRLRLPQLHSAISAAASADILERFCATRHLRCCLRRWWPCWLKSLDRAA